MKCRVEDVSGSFLSQFSVGEVVCILEGSSVPQIKLIGYQLM